MYRILILARWKIQFQLGKSVAVWSFTNHSILNPPVSLLMPFRSTCCWNKTAKTVQMSFFELCTITRVGYKMRRKSINAVYSLQMLNQPIIELTKETSHACDNLKSELPDSSSHKTRFLEFSENWHDTWIAHRALRPNSYFAWSSCMVTVAYKVKGFGSMDRNKYVEFSFIDSMIRYNY